MSIPSSSEATIPSRKREAYEIHPDGQSTKREKRVFGEHTKPSEIDKAVREATRGHPDDRSSKREWRGIGEYTKPLVDIADAVRNATRSYEEEIESLRAEVKTLMSLNTSLLCRKNAYKDSWNGLAGLQLIKSCSCRSLHQPPGST
jgi:hypothetical protein